VTGGGWESVMNSVLYKVLYSAVGYEILPVRTRSDIDLTCQRPSRCGAAPNAKAEYFSGALFCELLQTTKLRHGNTPG
jgi:hypothetical protein